MWGMQGVKQNCTTLSDRIIGANRTPLSATDRQLLGLDLHTPPPLVVESEDGAEGDCSVTRAELQTFLMGESRRVAVITCLRMQIDYNPWVGGPGMPQGINARTGRGVPDP